MAEVVAAGGRAAAAATEAVVREGAGLHHQGRGPNEGVGRSDWWAGSRWTGGRARQSWRARHTHPTRISRSAKHPVPHARIPTMPQPVSLPQVVRPAPTLAGARVGGVVDQAQAGAAVEGDAAKGARREHIRRVGPQRGQQLGQRRLAGSGVEQGAIHVGVEHQAARLHARRLVWGPHRAAWGGGAGDEGGGGCRRGCRGAVGCGIDAAHTAAASCCQPCTPGRRPDMLAEQRHAGMPAAAAGTHAARGLRRRASGCQSGRRRPQ